MRLKFNKAVETAPVIEMKGCTCQEASMHSRETFIACGDVAKYLVWHSRDRKAYAMCMPCAYHNVDNRGGILVGRMVDKCDGDHGGPPCPDPECWSRP